MTNNANVQLQFATDGKSYTALMKELFKTKTQQQPKEEVQAA